MFGGSITGNLTSEKINKLNEIGMVWNAREVSFDRAYEELRLYHDTYGNQDIKAKYVSPSGFNLGKWVSQKRVLVKKYGIDAVLDSEKQRKFNELGMIWDKNKEKDDLFIDAAESYYKVNGDINIPVNYISDDGLSLGNWLSQLKAGGKNGKKNLSEEQIARLKKLGFSTESKFSAQWIEKYELARQYYETHGDLNIPLSYTLDGVKFGKWISNIRSKRKHPSSNKM